MYKTLATTTLLFASTMVAAGPYVGAGYQAGATRVEKSALRAPVVDGRTLDLSDSDWNSGVKLLAGYRFSDHWALEAAWHGVESEDGIEVRQAGQDEEWDASVEGSHFTLAPVYRVALGARLGLRATAGLLYGDYDIRQSHWLDVENGPDQLISRSRSGRSKLGGMVGLGVEVGTPWKIDVIAEAQHQRTGIVSNTGLSLSAVYRF